MVESLLAVLIVSALFFGLFELSRLLMGKVMVEHAAMRVARARAVGFNGFMCVKAARVAAIPASGRRLHPGKDDPRGQISEAALARMYMRSPDANYANGQLRYEHWDQLEIRPARGGGASETALKTGWASLKGEATVDGFPIYLYDRGL